MELRCKKVFLSLFLLLCCFSKVVNAQDISVRSGFFLDSLKIGDQTGFYLVAEYPNSLNVLFPDSTYDFAPFEYERKRYFPTKTTAGKSYDSVVYYLSTFEIDRIQTLSVQVFQLNPMDCTAYASPRDTILLTELVKNLPDTLSAQNLPLKANTAYQNVLYIFNYPILIIAISVLLIAAAVIWVVFGKRIRKHFRVKRMRKAHLKFLEAYTRQVDNIKSSFSVITTENALSHWKKYMEQLESRPYTKLTTRETLQFENSESLGRNLHTIDSAIYGHDTDVVESLENLKVLADERFVQKLEEVKYG